MNTPFDPLSPAEQAVAADVSCGGFTRLGDGARPEGPVAERTLRGVLLRWLLLGLDGAPRLHEKGLRVSGAFIKGALDLEGCRLGADLRLADCAFDAPLALRSATLDSLLLDGSALPSLLAEKIEARGGVYLRGVFVKGVVDLRGARLGGALVCDGATIERPGGPALAADHLEARGGVFLRGATVRGVVDVSGARVHGSLDLTGATIEHAGADAMRAERFWARGDVLFRRATVSGRSIFTGARVGGDVDIGGSTFLAPGDDALSLNRASVEGALMMRDGARVEGLLNLNGTTVETLVDAPESWPAPGDLALNRFLYEAFLAAPSDSASRLDWLSRQNPRQWGEDFWPQPYEQAAKVLAATGNGDDARRVLVMKERLQRRARRARARPAAKRAVMWVSDGLLRLTIGYGRQPLRAFVWLVLFWLAGVAAYTAAEAAGAIRPAAVVALRSPEWVLCGVPADRTVTLASLGAPRNGLAAPGQRQVDCFVGQPEIAAYPQYNAWMMSLDTILPAVDTGQSAAWSPDVRRPVGYAVKAAGYVLTLLGWALSLLAVAGFSGIVRSS